MVCITGQVPSKLIGYDAFQETDITGITLPITKHSYLVTRVEDIMPAMKEAFHLAKSGRPGPGAGRHHQGRAAGEDRLGVGRDAGEDARLSSEADGRRRAELAKAVELITASQASRSSWPGRASCRAAR